MRPNPHAVGTIRTLVNNRRSAIHLEFGPGAFDGISAADRLAFWSTVFGFIIWGEAEPSGPLWEWAAIKEERDRILAENNWLREQLGLQARGVELPWGSLRP